MKATLFIMSIFEMVDGEIYKHESQLFNEESKAVSTMNKMADDWKETFHDDGLGEDVSTWTDIRRFDGITIIASDENYDGDEKTLLYITITEKEVEVKPILVC